MTGTVAFWRIRIYFLRFVNRHRVLLYLCNCDRSATTPIDQLARELNLDESFVWHLVEKLEKEGLARRATVRYAVQATDLARSRYKNLRVGAFISIVTAAVAFVANFLEIIDKTSP